MDYISRDELRKHLADCMTAEFFDSDMKKAVVGIDVYVENMPAADVQSVNQWISIKDRLPNENQKCLVYRDIDADLKITTGIWHSEWKAFDGLRHGTQLEDTIAWMPLPEPPKDGDTNG